MEFIDVLDYWWSIRMENFFTQDKYKDENLGDSDA